MPGTPVDRSLAAELVRDLSATTAATVPVLAPFTGAVLHDLPLSSREDVTAAVGAARAAQAQWSAAGFAHRRRVLLAAHDRLLANAGHLLDALQTETGKTRGQGFEEVFQAANVARYSALTARTVLRERRRRAGIPVVLRTRVNYRAKGVVGVVTPWNYPVALTAMDVIPALASGNAVVQKADNQGALSILTTRRAFIEAGLDPELWAVVVGDGDEIGSAIVDAADFVAFTGSTETGKKVAVRAAASLTGVSLELGGKNALIVLDDVKPSVAAANAVYACFSTMGQVCVSVERIYVVRAVAEEFTTAFVAGVKRLVPGAAFDYSTDIGSLSTKAQLDRVRAHVDDALAKGAVLLTGGEALPELGPYFYAPTVLTGVTAQMACSGQETFGPLVAITIVDTEAEAIAAANDSEFALNAAVFARSLRRARRVARQLVAGSVNLNEGYRASFSSIDAPMGGMKQSGLGRRNGREGLLRFVDSRTISEATGILTLPRTGAEFARLRGIMVLLLRVLKAVRRR